MELLRNAQVRGIGLATSRGEMRSISTEELKEKIETSAPFALVEVLQPKDYESGHIPLAINIPLNDEFEDSVRSALPDKEQPIVVYCASTSCDASPKAAKKLEDLGYTKVMDYEGGKKDWTEAGLRLEQSGDR